MADAAGNRAERRTVGITGASGFIGRALVTRFHDDGDRVRGAYRNLPAAGTPFADEPVLTDDLSASTDWSAFVDGLDAVVHTAARVHVQARAGDDDAFHRANVEGSVALARQAGEAGVRRFIFVSSIKANGEETAPGKPFRADDILHPQDAYGRSKAEAEETLTRVCAETGMELVIVRPPLVYGPGVRANFLAMMRWMDAGWPLPLASIDNERSMIALPNLVDLLTVAVRHEAAAGAILLASDGQDLSTSALLRRLAHHMQRPDRTFSLSPAMLTLAGRLTGKANAVRKLTSSLQVDASSTRTLLNWEPPLSVDEGLRQTAEHYMRFQRGRAGR